LDREPKNGIAKQLTKLAKFHADGVLSDKEFEDLKLALINSDDRMVHPVPHEEALRPPAKAERHQMAGGIVGIVAGTFATIASLVTLSIGGLGGIATEEYLRQGGMLVDNSYNALFTAAVDIGAGFFLVSLLTIILGAIAITEQRSIAAKLLVLTSGTGLLLSNVIVAPFMALSLIGGIIALVRSKNSSTN